MRIFIISFLTALAGVVFAAATSQVNTYVNGNVLTADQLNSEFSNLYTTINSLDNANLSASAAIDPTKIATTIEGNALSRQSDGSLDVAVDGSTVKISSNQLVISDLPATAIASDSITSTQIQDGTITLADRAVRSTATTATAGNVALSSGSGGSESEFLTGTSGDLTGSTINITTLGSPVRVSIVPGTATTQSYVECEDATTDPCILELARAGATVTQIPFYTEGGEYRLPPGAFSFLDTPVAGTYEYKIRYSVPSATALRILNVRLMAYEL